jgi:cysteine synthase A
MLINNILDKVGNTPLVAISQRDIPNLNLFAKLEFYNPTGSVKDRAASYIIKRLLDDNIINKDTTLIESSSGNFGVALSAYSKINGLKFICVIDQNTSPVNEMLIKASGAITIKITKPDMYGGYLLNRIAKVKEIITQTPNIYWVNQYGNPLNAEAYNKTLGREICEEAPNEIIDYVFMGVSSGGTITGVSQRVKEKFPLAKLIAVDIFGSVIFGGAPMKRYIPGIGSSMAPKILQSALIDDVVFVNEIETVKCCKELLQEHNIFAGGSSGSVFAAIKKYFSCRKNKKPINVVCIFPDRGERYCNTVYNEGWCKEYLMDKEAVKIID